MLFSQLLLPQFNPVQKQTTFSGNHEESSPILYNNGDGLYFNRIFTKGDGESTTVTGHEILFAELGKKGWGKPLRLLTESDVEGQNLIVGTNNTGTRIYIFNSRPDGDTLYRKLYFLDKTEEKYKWTKPTEVIIPGLVYGYDFIHFYINPEETVILISKAAKGRTDEDMFVSLKDEQGNWGSIINLGRTLNTNRYELGSFITNNLKTIYFSSEGHGGYGAADVFVSMRLDDTWQKWTKPLNLGEPINSADYDAFFIMANANEVYFTSDRGDQHSNIFKGTVTGEVVLANTDSLKGVFIHDGEVVEGITFIVTDIEGNKVADITTDKKGVFSFKKLKGMENYLIKMKEEDSDFVGSKIYFVNETEGKTDRFVYNKDGFFVNSKDLSASENVEGVYNYNSLPALRTALVVLDENGFPLDTIYTDEKGRFTYSALSLENGVSLVPLNMTEDEFINADIYFFDKEGNRLQAMKPKQVHVVAFDEMVLVEENSSKNIKPAGIDLENVKGAQQEIGAWNTGAAESKNIYFEFEKTQSNKEESNKLSMLVSLVKLDKDRKIILTGHTDHTGEEETNYIYGLLRAKFVRAHLISKGVPAKNIEVFSKGELEPQANNASKEGRAKNRRVEIRII